MLLRKSSFCWFALFVNYASAITLLQVIQSHPDLSTLNAYISNSTNTTKFLSNANNFTFLAPNNKAIGDFLSNNQNVLTEGLLEATLQYSLLQGGYPKLSFADTPKFVASNLVNASYANVTGGQGVELVLDSNGTPQAVTGNQSSSAATTTDIICTGGILHIMSSVVSVPIQAVSEFSAAGLSYLVSILNTGGFLSVQNSGYVSAVLELPDVTYFIPNSAAALASTTALAANSTPQELQTMFEYHIVPGFVGYSTDLKQGMSLKTAQGSNVSIIVQGGEIYVNSARVIARDYLVANGVVQVLDNLLNPNDTSPPPKATPSSSPSPTASASASATTTPSFPSSAEAKSTPTATTSSALSTNATIGISAGCGTAALILLSLLTFLLIRRRRRRNRAQPPQPRDSGSWSSATEKQRSPLRPIRTDLGEGEQSPRFVSQEPLSAGSAGMGFVSQESWARDVAIPIPLRSPERRGFI